MANRMVVMTMAMWVARNRGCRYIMMLIIMVAVLIMAINADMPPQDSTPIGCSTSASLWCKTHTKKN